MPRLLLLGGCLHRQRDRRGHGFRLRCQRREARSPKRWNRRRTAGGPRRPRNLSELALSLISRPPAAPSTASSFYAPHMLNMLNMVNPQTRFIGVFTGGVFTGGVFTGGAPGGIRTRDLRVMS